MWVTEPQQTCQDSPLNCLPTEATHEIPRSLAGAPEPSWTDVARPGRSLGPTATHHPVVGDRPLPADDRCTPASGGGAGDQPRGVGAGEDVPEAVTQASGQEAVAHE